MWMWMCLHFAGMQICLIKFSCRMRGRNRSKWFAPYLPFPSCLLSGLENPDLAQEGFVILVILGKWQEKKEATGPLVRHSGGSSSSKASVGWSLQHGTPIFYLLSVQLLSMLFYAWLLFFTGIFASFSFLLTAVHPILLFPISVDCTSLGLFGFTRLINSQHCKENKFMVETWFLSHGAVRFTYVMLPCPLFSLFRLSFSESFNLYLCSSSLYMRSSVSCVPYVHVFIIKLLGYLPYYENLNSFFIFNTAEGFACVRHIIQVTTEREKLLRLKPGRDEGRNNE